MRSQYSYLTRLLTTLTLTFDTTNLYELSHVEGIAKSNLIVLALRCYLNQIFTWLK